MLKDLEAIIREWSVPTKFTSDHARFFIYLWSRNEIFNANF